MKGNTDRPIELYGNDEFGIDPYISGLAEFIEECDTPMTIAVQGDWGCGKTSMMNMTRDYLKQKDCIIDVWFNTWQFSQFNTDEQLSLTFLQHMVKELGKSITDTTTKQKIVDKMTPIMKTITIGMTKHFVGSDVGDVVSELMSKAKLDIVDEISELKQSFQELIFKVTNNGEKRVVVFIDDLDRLQPVRAVELLEILKLFIDCDNCIFVMAIDTSVVFQGIREKYGSSMSDEKAQSFFDKIIQLPFKMPVAYYKLDKLTERLLSFLQDEDMSVDLKKEYVKIIRKVTNGNPRSIKRLSNSILLFDKVAEKKGIYSNQNAELHILIRRILVLLNCIQMRYEKTYDFLVSDMNYRHMQDILDLKLPDKSDSQRGEKLIDKLKTIGMSQINIEDMNTFYDVYSFFLDAVQKTVQLYFEITKSKVDAVQKVMQIISLGNIFNDDDDTKKVHENKMPETKAEASQNNFSPNTTPDFPLEYLYLGMIKKGENREVYNKLVQNGIYLPLNHIIEDNLQKAEFSVNLARVQESPLFRKMDEILGSYYDKDDSQIKCIKELDDKIIYTIHYGKNDECKFILLFQPYYRTLAVKVCDKMNLGFKFTNTMGIFEKVKETIQIIKKEYGLLQDTYGKILVRDKTLEEGIQEKTDDDGNITEITIKQCIVANDKMAEAFIELSGYIAEHKDMLQDNAQASYNSAMMSMLSAANAAAPVNSRNSQ